MATAATRTAILDAAERRFAEHGFDGTSIRDITDEAGANVAAVHYHFGGKQDLLRAVTDRLVEPISQRRSTLLDGLLAASGSPDARALIDAFIRPDVEQLQSMQGRGPHVAHFLGRLYADPTPWIREMANTQFRPTADRFIDALTAAIPHLTEADVRWRLSRMVAVIVDLFTTWPDDVMSDAEAANTVDRYVDFLTPAMTAPHGR